MDDPNSDIPDPDDALPPRRNDPIPSYDEDGVRVLPEPYDDNDPQPPFDVFNGMLGPQDPHEAYRWAREPDSSLNGLKKYATPRQIEDLHLYFLGVYDKHHGF